MNKELVVGKIEQLTHEKKHSYFVQDSKPSDAPGIISRGLDRSRLEQTIRYGISTVGYSIVYLQTVKVMLAPDAGDFLSVTLEPVLNKFCEENGWKEKLLSQIKAIEFRARN